MTNIKLPNISIINEETFKDNKITNIDLSVIVEIKKLLLQTIKLQILNYQKNLTTIEDETFQNNLLSDINIPNNIQNIRKSSICIKPNNKIRNT